MLITKTVKVRWNAKNKDYRYNVDNGITLCSECHVLFHSIYGKKNNTLQQLNEFLEYEYETNINKD